MDNRGGIPSGTVVVVASASAVNYVGLTVITASDLVYEDGKGQTTTLSAVPAGITITCVIRVVSTCSGVVLAYQGV